MTINQPPTGGKASASDADAAFLLPLRAAPDEAILAQLRHRLAREAQEAGALDVSYRTLDTPVGTLLLAATERGLVRVAYAVEGHDGVLEMLAETISPRIMRAPARLEATVRQLDDYFRHERRTFNLPLDFSLARGFRRVVLDQLRGIGFGSTASYSAVAAAAGSPRAVRAVGTACARNPLPVVVPCHRVVRSDGTLGQYVGGLAAKTALLALEGAA